jgi:hypothetical protein
MPPRLAVFVAPHLVFLLDLVIAQLGLEIVVAVVRAQLRRPDAPANRGLFVNPREISVSVGMRGGPGRTRTSNQTFMNS